MRCENPIKTEDLCERCAWNGGNTEGAKEVLEKCRGFQKNTPDPYFREKGNEAERGE